MKKICLLILILLMYQPEAKSNDCKWVIIAMDNNNLTLAKKKYYSTCNYPLYKSEEGVTFLTFAVLMGSADQTKWALSLPQSDPNSKYGAVSVLYHTVLNIYKNKIEDANDDRMVILKLLLEHGADPLLPNDSEGDPPYSNGESTYHLIKDLKMEDTKAGQLVLKYVKGGTFE